MQKGFEKRFNSGDIVYFHHQQGNYHTVNFGMVDEQFSDAVCIDLLEIKEHRIIDGIPIDDVPNIGKWNKLPKGWSYNTKLFDLSWTKEDWMNEEIDIKNPNAIREAYDKGYLVKSDTIFQGVVETEITKDGWRLVKRYPQWHKTKITHTSIRPDKVYFTYQEAQNEVDSVMAELKRISELSDYDWSVEQIEKEINRTPYLTDDERKAYKKWLLQLDNVEDIEVRLSGGNLQWKYWKNKRWNNIEYADVMRK